jgi:hypothetical protein
LLVEGDINPDGEDAGEGLLEVVVGDVQPDAKIVTTSRAAIIPTIYFVFI